jgi:hypothetical protein
MMVSPTLGGLLKVQMKRVPGMMLGTLHEILRSAIDALRGLCCEKCQIASDRSQRRANVIEAGET